MSEIDNDRFCEAARLARAKGSDIIASSPTIPADDTTLAHRIVLRDQGDKFVVHMQIFEGSKSYFEHGHYFPKRPEDGTLAEHDRIALRKAWAKFEERSRRILGMANELHDYKAAADVAEQIIEALLPDDIEDRADTIRDDYMLESNIETFEELTGKSLWDKAGEGADDEDGPDDEEDE